LSSAEKKIWRFIGKPLFSREKGKGGELLGPAFGVKRVKEGGNSSPRQKKKGRRKRGRGPHSSPGKREVVDHCQGGKSIINRGGKR